MTLLSSRASSTSFAVVVPGTMFFNFATVASGEVNFVKEISPRLGKGATAGSLPDVPCAILAYLCIAASRTTLDALNGGSSNFSVVLGVHAAVWVDV